MPRGNHLAKTLQEIGLTDKQAQVYLALLALESTTAYEIAQHCDVKKPTVYVVLEELRRKGLVLKVPHAKKALFAARDISEYLAEQKRKLHAVESIVPMLHALGGPNTPNVYFFNGLRGLEEAIDFKFDSMRGKTYYNFYGDLADGEQSVIDLYAKWDRKAVEAGISFNIVMPRKGTEKWFMGVTKSGQEATGLAKLAQEAKENVRIRFLEEYSHPGNISIEIAEDFVRIDDAKNLSATVIDDKKTAMAMRQIFQIVWQKGV
ncbi:MAG: helix-turn-helix domain-containing protein [Candidatus Paceibacterota bacterium]